MLVCPYVVAKRTLSWGNKTLESNVDLRQNKSLILYDKYYIFRKRSILNPYISNRDCIKICCFLHNCQIVKIIYYVLTYNFVCTTYTREQNDKSYCFSVDGNMYNIHTHINTHIHEYIHKIDSSNSPLLVTFSRRAHTQTCICMRVCMYSDTSTFASTKRYRNIVRSALIENVNMQR